MTDYIAQYENPRFRFEREESERLAASLADGACIEDGVMRWESNNNVVPEDVARFAAYLGHPIDLDASRAARDADLKVLLEAYRRAAPHDSAEARFERRAAFGPGVEVVDVLSGRRYRT
ncbi:hypothetical protein J2T57_001663 [Natronocella acetinitrilica]|uniref:Uncharacterized protein n=2 Tax=Natronocella acetinitrilica TaxID=414046 RepID=A0AAE3G4F1_9GAMM|nr:hypothetical protein [Natronocella acetinitrilica]